MHLDENFAKSTVYGQRIVHGTLVSSLFSALPGSELPAEGVVYLAQYLSFKATIFLDEKITAQIEIVKVREDKPIVTV